jgi:hypothetical protein
VHITEDLRSSVGAESQELQVLVIDEQQRVVVGAAGGYKRTRFPIPEIDSECGRRRLPSWVKAWRAAVPGSNQRVVPASNR